MRPLRPGPRLGVGMGATISGMLVTVLVPHGHGWIRWLFALYAAAFYVVGQGIIEQERDRA